MAAKQMLVAKGEKVTAYNLAMASRGIESQIKVLDDIGKKFGLDIVVVDSIAYKEDNGYVINSALNGAYDPKTGRVFVAMDAQEGALMYVGMHEIAHALKATNEAAYNELDKFVAEYLNDTDKTMDSLIKGQQERFGYTPEEAREEVISNTLPAILADEKMVYKIAGTKAGRRLYNKLTGFQKSLNDTVARLSKLEDWEQIDILKNDVETINKMVELFEKGMAQREQVQKQDDVKASRNTSVYYDYSKSFKQQVDDWMNGNFPATDTFIMGKTPDVYIKVGLSALPLTMDQTHVDYALKNTKNDDHHLKEALLKKLPQLMSNPIAIIESASRPNDSLVAIVSGIVNGHQLMAAVRIGSNGRQNGARIDSNHLVSTQGRENAVTKLLKDAINKEAKGNVGVYYWNKNKAIALMTKSKVQFLGGHIKDGFLHSILDSNSPVNKKVIKQTESQQFKKWFRKSKVKNADGTPKIVYHGTLAKGIEAFDKNFIGTRYAADEEGFFFIDRKSIAEDYATSEFDSSKKGEVIPVYLSIQKPLVFDKNYAVKNGYGNIFKNNDVIDVWDNFQGAILEDAHNAGADGIIVNDGQTEMYVVFEPTQIKHATENIGLFDANNPKIRYSFKTDKGAADRAWYAENAKPINVAIKSNDGVKVGKMSYPEEAQQKAKSAAKTQRQTVYEWASTEEAHKQVQELVNARKTMNDIVRSYAKRAEISQKEARTLLNAFSNGEAEAKGINTQDMNAFAKAKAAVDRAADISKANRAAYRSTADELIAGSETWKDNRKAG